MSIYLYSGGVGSGKSLHAASDIRFELTRRHPRPVLANFELSPTAPVPDERRGLFSFVPNSEISADLFIDFADQWWETHDFAEDHIILCLDECQIIWNARTWSQGDRLSFLEFLSQSRKYGYKVILIAQNMAMIDNQFRMLVDVDVNHRRVGNWGWLGPILSALTLRRLFARVSYAVINGKTRERVGLSWYVARSRDMRMYDSYARFKTRAAKPLPVGGA